jgi:hypothetical protein
MLRVRLLMLLMQLLRLRVLQMMPQLLHLLLIRLLPWQLLQLLLLHLLLIVLLLLLLLPMPSARTGSPWLVRWDGEFSAWALRLDEQRYGSRGHTSLH